MRSLVLLSLLYLNNVFGRKVVDLTHTFDDKAPKWPLQGLVGTQPAVYFDMEKLFEDYVGEQWIAIKKVEFYEHMGTHIDAPFHTSEGRRTLEAIPPEDLVGPGVVIDVRQQVKLNPDYAASVADLQAHEEVFGRIPYGAIVMLNTGWATRYPNPEQIFGTTMINDSSTFHFPGYGLDACKWLLEERQVKVVGIDTPSTDIGKATELVCHKLLQSNEIPLLEYVANLDGIPNRNTTIILGAIKTRGGTGGPTRILAIIDGEEDDVNSGVSITRNGHLVMFVIWIIGLLVAL